MPRLPRAARCGSSEARTRLRTAQAYLDVANSVLNERDRDEYLNVSAGLSVLACIAASDAICCLRLRRWHRGDDQRSAAVLLSSATPDGGLTSNSFFAVAESRPPVGVPAHFELAWVRGHAFDA
jgi:hypothetical protein